MLNVIFILLFPDSLSLGISGSQMALLVAVGKIEARS